MPYAEELFARIRDTGRDFIENLLNQPITEDQFLDFKRSSDRGEGRNLSPTDRTNFERAVSGFANSEGGVIVWGVDCRPNERQADIPTQLVLLSDPVRFKGWLETIVGGLTSPAVGGVQHHVIEFEQNRGIVVSLIPQSSAAPHQAMSEKRYFMRVGSSFQPVPHAILAGMFGRRPQPKVFPIYGTPAPQLDKDGSISYNIEVYASNAGAGIASDVFFNFFFENMPSKASNAGATEPTRTIWSFHPVFGQKFYFMSNREIRLPPDAQLYVTTLRFRLAPPFEAALVYSGALGAEGSAPWRFRVPRRPDTLTLLYNGFTERVQSGNHDDARHFWHREFCADPSGRGILAEEA